MYRDNSLVPSEAIRLCALGLLAQRPSAYAEIAGAVRHFSGRIVGPSLDLLAPSLELLKVEGLLEAEGTGDNAMVRLTEAGRKEFFRLMTARMRGPLGDVNKLILALKLRFLHLLDKETQLAQLDLLSESVEGELVRLTDLRRHHAEEPGYLVAWLDHEISQLESRRDWLAGLADKLA
jgi:DNA-binding PadR family transcriptional regulator